MDTVEIKWIGYSFPLQDITTHPEPTLDENGFYAILLGKGNPKEGWESLTLLYIGQAFDQTIRKRVPQQHKAYKCVNDWLKANPGYDAIITLGQISFPGRLTQPLVDDTECCLIFTNQPKCNETCKESYNGRELSVKNAGKFVPVKSLSKCKAG